MKKVKKLTPGMLVADINKENATILEFVKKNGENCYFKYVSGPPRYFEFKNGFIIFSSNHILYEKD
jgi:hypothetical protein